MKNPKIFPVLELSKKLIQEKERLISLIPVHVMDMYKGQLKVDRMQLSTYLPMIEEYNDIEKQLTMLENKVIEYDLLDHIKELEKAILGARNTIEYLKLNPHGEKTRLQIQKDLLSSWQKELYELKKELIMVQ